MSKNSSAWSVRSPARISQRVLAGVTVAAGGEGLAEEDISVGMRDGGGEGLSPSAAVTA